MVTISRFFFITLLVAVAGGYLLPPLVRAQNSYYTWNVTAYDASPYQDFPRNIPKYPFQITDVAIVIPPDKKSAEAKKCLLYLTMSGETTALSTDEKDFDAAPDTKWRTSRGCVLSLAAEPDLHAQVALITDDSATPGAVRSITMNASVFPDYAHPDCKKVSLGDIGGSQEILFPMVAPTESPTPNPWLSNATPTPAPPTGPTPSPTPTPTPKPPVRQPLTVTVPSSTSIRTVTFEKGPDCTSLVVFRPWNE
ncbi:MAG TPA: hypothetical protein VGX91_01135 [Candidatus Cybelea sp.]|jgi:hypothetical protein|nr:hypothetical protein [Candidatus Cybelea sp.]